MSTLEERIVARLEFIPCTKKYSELNRWDVINAYHGRKLKPCVVVGKRVTKDTVILRLHPVTPRTELQSVRRVETQRFQPSAWVEVLGQKRLLTTDAQYKENIASLLQPGREPVNSRTLRDRGAERGLKMPPAYRINGYLHELRREGLAILREKSLIYARAPLTPGVVGIPVLELPNTRSEMLGWIEDWKEMRNGSLLPIVRFLDGTLRACPDERLDPTENPIYIRWVEQVRSGNVPEPEEFIDRLLLKNCDIRDRDFVALPEVVELAIAHHLGIVSRQIRSVCHLPYMDRAATRTQIIDHLNTYYPGWRFGVNVHQTRSAA